MDVWSWAPMDTRRHFAEERGDLLGRLHRLTDEEWSAPTSAGSWTVKDVALHLLEGDLGRLSRGRDGDLSGLLPLDDGPRTLAKALAAKNQTWVDAARQLSHRLVVDLLTYSTQQLDEWTHEADLLAPSRLTWASSEPVPAWLDLAREMTETWVHHQQIRAAVGLPTSHANLETVLRTFVWALPHQYRVAAPTGIRLVVDLHVGGCWHLVAQAESKWSLEEGGVADPAASVVFTAEAAWRSFTGAAMPPGGVRATGPRALTDPVLDVRGIIA